MVMDTISPPKMPEYGFIPPDFDNYLEGIEI
jgi:hypothetical protein